MKKIIIKKEKSGQRLDKFLTKEVFCNEKISRGEIIREIRSGKIMVNGKMAKPSCVLKNGDEITVPSLQLSPERREGLVFPNPKIKIKIIFENSNFLVIDKSAGIQVHPVEYPPRRIAASPLFHRVNPDTHKKENTIVNWLVAKYPKIKNVHDRSRDAELRPGIVHRLDKDTSGVMVIAKNQKTFNALKKLFQSRKARKNYLAIVYGKLDEKQGVIKKPIAKAANYKKQIIASERTRTKIRPAITEYKVAKEMKKYSLVEVYPKTGRTHQIRIHFWSIGHSIVGDKIYKTQDTRYKNLAAERQLLHAEKLGFKLGGKEYTFKSAMPKDMKGFIKELQWGKGA